MTYTVEELIPVVAELTRKYTSGESTSVTYERANQLMEAVLYCIRECGEHALAVQGEIPARQAYELGYERVLEKVRRTQERYNRMILSFRSYGNKNYEDTVTKALPGFFRYYDVQFAPQNSGITMDYPLVRPLRNVTGIDAIELYVEGICLEQEFLGAFPEAYVCEILTRYEKGYKKQFFNLCSIFLRHVLGCTIIRRKMGTESDGTEYRELERILCGLSREQLKGRLEGMIHRIALENWSRSPELERYLVGDAEDFAVQLEMALENDCLRNVVVFTSSTE